MKLSEIVKALELTYATPEKIDPDVTDGYTSDLLSDVMGNAREGSILITIQAHKNSVAVASLSGITAILICNGREIPTDMLDAAISEGIGIVCTGDNQYVSSYKIHRVLAGS
ncbi:MAG: iron-sulfur binding hydrogenase [Spirochaetes bacterium GWF1_51_8]|nr:MAG: iron-sulfur binding hydrogenase [Spirochaetes bacterium GWF1_51_8]